MEIKAKRIIYGIPSKMEYLGVFKVGDASFEVPFTGGGTNKQGNIIPATYMTDSLMMQQIIENSEQFKNKLIVKMKAINLDKQVYVASHYLSAEEEKSADKEDNDEGANDGNGDDTSKGAAVLEKVEFACIDDAKDYLEEKFGVARAKLIGKAKCIAAGKANGIEVVFTD